MSDRVTLSVNTLNEVLNVLAQRPYVEVAEVINKVQEDARPIVEEVNTDDEHSSAQA